MVLWDKHPTAATEIMVDAMMDDDNAAAIPWSIILFYVRPAGDLSRIHTNY
jgi:hypothetical protein